MSTTSKKKSKKGWLIAIGTIIVLIATSLLNIKVRNIVFCGYYYIFKFDHFSEGDDVYASKTPFQNKQINAIGIYRLMRPLQPEELEKTDRYSRLDINIDKDSAYNVNGSQVAVTCFKYFTLDKMRKEHSSLIGSYIDCKLLDVFIDDKKQKRLKSVFYSIIPNEKLVESGIIYFPRLPVNYTWVDSTLYIIPANVSNKDFLK